MASLPQYPQRVASAAILLVLLLRFSPHVAAQVDPPVPGPTPLQCPPGENPTDLGGGVTQCCSYLQTCHLTPPGSVPNSSGQFLNFTATCCPTGSFCLRDYSPFAACVAPPPDQCTACPVSTNAFGPPSINSCYFAFAAGRFCCSLQVCSGGVGASTGQTCCDQGNKTQCTRPLQGIASPTADSAGICCEPGQVLCNDRCCNAANCVPAPGASAAFGPYTCNTPGPATIAPAATAPTPTGPFPTFATKAGGACDPSSALPFTCYNDVGSSYACCPTSNCPYPGPVARCADTTATPSTATTAPTPTSVTTATPSPTTTATTAPAVTTSAPAVTTAAPVATTAPAPAVTYATGSGNACDPGSALPFTCYNNNGSTFACCADPSCPAPGPVARCAGGATAAPQPTTTPAPAGSTAAPAVTTAAPAVTTAAPVATGAPAPSATYATGSGYACDPSSALPYTCYNGPGSFFVCCAKPTCNVPGATAACAP